MWSKNNLHFFISCLINYFYLYYLIKFPSQISAGSKKYSKIYPQSYANTHDGITDVEIHDMVNNTKI